jgi:hypothetical protein
MSDPTARAWTAVRRQVDERATVLDTEQRAVVRAFADHVAFDSEEGQSLVFTVGDDTAADVAAVADGLTGASRVSVADAGGVRFLLVETTAADAAVLLAGGLDRGQFRGHDPEEPARTVVRRLGETVAVFEHDRLAPFVADLSV